MHKIVIIVNNTVKNFKVAEGLNLNFSPHKINNYVLEVVVNPTAVNILHYINVSNEHIVLC